MTPLSVRLYFCHDVLRMLNCGICVITLLVMHLYIVLRGMNHKISVWLGHWGSHFILRIFCPIMLICDVKACKFRPISLLVAWSVDVQSTTLLFLTRWQPQATSYGCTEHLATFCGTYCEKY